MSTRQQRQAWLAAHAADGPGCWLEHPRGGSGVSYDELVLEALRVGWWTVGLRGGAGGAGRRPATRATRVSAIAASAARGERAFP